MKKDTRIIAIVGMPGSGKSVAANYFKDKRIPVLRLGDQTEIGLADLNLPLTPQNEQKYREQIRKELGMEAMAIKIAPRIEGLIAVSNPSVLVLDGVYSWPEYAYLRKHFSSIFLLAVISDRNIRYSRLASRDVRPLTKQEAEIRDVAEIEKLEKGGPIAFADYYVQNNASFDEFTSQLESVYQKILI